MFADMELRTTMEFVKDMGMGINLGNTFDCSGNRIAKTVRAQETAWGSPVITKEMIKCCADVGFGVMRLPVSWTILMDGDGNIDKDFMDRIDEVVDWILDSGMCCIRYLRRMFRTISVLKSSCISIPAFYRDRSRTSLPDIAVQGGMLVRQLKKPHELRKGDWEDLNFKGTSCKQRCLSFFARKPRVVQSIEHNIPAFSEWA